eukprot:CAMPEP_0203638680 /NCGR_PEP_ID=MMETSP0088-20131115/4641_1 /ASSEMBLY_ACC=CAM_ASM_001087 /TAXON_ID=426623 /ORGANISM="Chaetoceros affinis, Strain CCMP159" /LENGTH=278 /DNA_ID=CAMNT_0050493369 /DNA_START=371 /DNA_END=1207 /DNA_ORIENTATION=+
MTSLFEAGMRSSNVGASVSSSSMLSPYDLRTCSTNDETKKSSCNNVLVVRSFCKTTKLDKDGPADQGYASPDDRFNDDRPTVEYAKLMPHGFGGMRHEQILQLCVEGSYSARKEAMTRNVMAKDSIGYEEAAKVVTKIIEDNRKGMWSAYLPYHFGMGISLFGAGISFPMIFDLNTVQAFNDRFVTAELPDLKDLETFLEVGSCSWSWMEPIIGQISFVLLALQFARNQALNLGVKPYGNWVTKNRADRLVAMYPQYDEIFIRWISEAASLHGPRAMK